MTKGELLNLYRALDNLGNVTGARMSYGVAKNLSILKPDVDALQKAIDMTDDFKKFEEERVELVKKHAILDEKGNPMIDTTRNEYVISEENKPAFEKNLAKLRKENSAVIEAREKQVKEFGELLKTEIEPNLHKIQQTDLPESITPAQTFAILPMIFDLE